jgi:hypothetical protein
LPNNFDLSVADSSEDATKTPAKPVTTPAKPVATPSRTPVNAISSHQKRQQGLLGTGNAILSSSSWFSFAVDYKFVEQ